MGRLKYSVTYEGLIQAIVEGLGSSLQNAPYGDNWEGIINAFRDCSAPGARRPEGYPDSIQGVIEVVVDCFLGGGNVVGKYPLTFQGVRDVLIEALNPDGNNRPYPPSLEGILAVLIDGSTS